MKPDLLYCEHPFLALRYFEWAAVERLYAKPRGERMYQLYPDLPFALWLQQSGDLTTKAQRYPETEGAWAATDLAKVGLDKELDTLEEVYAHIEAKLKPKRTGKALKDAKRAMGQREYQREALGEGFVDNPPLVSSAKTACKAIAEEGGSPEAVIALIDVEASRLEAIHCVDALSGPERETLRSTIMLSLIHI